MSDWQTRPELDTTTVSTLVSAVGKPVFDDMKTQFVADLERLGREYAEALARQDGAEARSIAHALKGAASNIGLMRLGALAAELEKGNDAFAAHLETVLDSAVSQLMAA
jgi:HPt (histidine-containing phosphotransfer) domain-containing protein